MAPTLEDVMDAARRAGPMFAGALFGAGWWVWADAVACSHDKTPPLWYLPGVTATLAILMVNAVRRDELVGYDADGYQSQKRLWLLLSYLVSFGALGWAAAGLLAYFGKAGHDTYVGGAGVVQCVLIVSSGLVYWVTRQGEGASY